MGCRLPNEKLKATLIQRFDGSALLFGPKGKAIEFKAAATIHHIQAEAEKFGWIIAIEHLHRAGEGRIG